MTPPTICGRSAQPLHALELLARNMRELRRSRQMSQETLARSTGMHRTLVSHIEASRRNLRLDTVERIADGLQVSPDALFEASPCKLARRVRLGTDLRSTLARNVLALRQAKGIDTCTLATRCGITSRLMSSFESRNANVSVPTVEKIALVLSVPIGELFKDDEHSFRYPATGAESVPWMGGKPMAAAVVQ